MTALSVLVILAVIATLGVLLTGLVSMGVGGTFDRRHSLQLMEGRVALQAVALALIAIAVIWATL
jgi:hypothetical protein